MGSEIGSVNINLRLSLAQFSKDVKTGTEEARTATKNMADTMRGQTQQAKAAMALLGEEIGITIPRHLRNFMASLPGVGNALNAAFSSVAVLALIELVVKAAEKIEAYWASLSKLSAEEQQMLDKATKGAKELLDHKTKLVSAEYELRIAQADGMEKDRLRVEKAVALVNLSKEYVGTLQQEKQHLEQIFRTQQDAAKAAERQAEATSNIANPYGQGLGLAQTAMAAKLSEQAKGSSEALKGVTNTLEEADAALKHSQASMIDEGKALDKHIKQKAEEAQKAIEKLNKELAKAMEFAMGGRVGSRTDWPMLSGLGPGVPGMGGSAQMPKYGGTKEAEENYKILHDQDEALKQMQTEYTKTRTAQQQYDDELARQNALLKALGPSYRGIYDQALKDARDKLDGTKKAWQNLGQSIGSTISQAALFGRSWTDALKSILVQVAELIVQMELLKTLGGAGGGGFLGSLVKGLTGGRAGGGSVYAGGTYLVGEQGPELFTPGASGFITPHGGFGGVTYAPYIDCRNATSPAETEMRVRQAIQESERRAVVTAITAVNENQKRRR